MKTFFLRLIATSNIGANKKLRMRISQSFFEVKIKFIGEKQIIGFSRFDAKEFINVARYSANYLDISKAISQLFKIQRYNYGFVYSGVVYDENLESFEIKMANSNLLFHSLKLSLLASGIFSALILCQVFQFLRFLLP